jgi:hypothetical protein
MILSLYCENLSVEGGAYEKNYFVNKEKINYAKPRNTNT